MKKISFILLLLSALTVRGQHLINSQKTSVTFFSSTIMEDIEGTSIAGHSIINPQTGELVFKVANNSFQFKKKLMQEHFNENYMESDQFPYTTFKGKLKELPDLEKDGSYKVTVEGNLDVHGVTKAYQSMVDLIVDKGIVSAKTVFKVRIADHQIKIPKLVFKNIAEYVEVRVAAQYPAK